MRRAGFLLLSAALAGPVTAHEETASQPAASAADRAALAKAGDAARPQQPPGQQLALKPTRRIAFTTDEGTWMSLDRAPDGRRLVFDLLGDLYAMPAAGGRAERISGGLAVDAQPTYSPDGRWIAFVSDRSGAENLWVARPDGSGARQISFGDDDTVLVSPAWSADGRALFVSRYRPSLGAYELWQHGLDGAARLMVPIRDTADAPREGWRSSLGAVASPDGRSLYFARLLGTPGFDSIPAWTIVRRDLASGVEETIVAEPDGPRKAQNPGAFFRPALSPNGRLLAYARRTDGQTELRLRDLASGDDRRLAFPIEPDQGQASVWQDLVPRYAFTPDGRAVLITRNGGFERIDLASGAASPIRFTAKVDLALGPLTRRDIREETGPVRARLVQTPVVSRDGRQVAFSALGGLYLMPLTRDAAPRRIATDGPAFQPSWSHDGQRIAFVTWTAEAGGAVWTVAADGASPPVRISTAPAFYTYPVFTPDDRGLVTVRSAQAQRLRLYMEFGLVRAADVVLLSTAGGAERILAQGQFGGRPQFATAAGQVHVQSDDGLATIDLATGARTRLAQLVGPGWYFQDGPVPVDEVQVSPDGKWLLARIAQQLHLVERPQGGRLVDLSDPHLRHRRITAAGVDHFGWAEGGRTITWSLGSTFHRRPLASVTLNPADRPGWTPDAPTRGTAGYERYAMPVAVPRDTPAGTLLLRGAAALTMGPAGAIEDADILVVDGRIAGIGRRGSIAVPNGAVIRELAGKTILPGFIDTHDHIAEVRREVLDLTDWGLRARLAWGLTTVFDPSTLTIDMLAYRDLLDAGMMIGPRLPSTGVALFSMERFQEPADVAAVLGRYRDDYRLGNVKQYRTGNRRVRQLVAAGAAAAGLQPTAEGALALKLDLSQILDGYAGHEHSLVAPLRRDMIELMARSGTSYTATLQINNGGFPAEDYFVAAHDPHADPKVARFWPHVFADQALLRRDWRRLEEYRFPGLAGDVARVQRAGGVVGIGAHGDAPGIGFHWEMEAHVLGGMTPLETLRAATIGSAETIGRAAEFGSLERGKFADLVILDADPRADIRRTRAIAQVMKNGRLYDAATLAELWPQPRPLGAAWYQDESSSPFREINQ